MTVCGVLGFILLSGSSYGEDGSGSVRVTPEAVVLRQGNLCLPVSLVCPTFTVDGTERGGKGCAIDTNRTIESGQMLELPCEPIVFADQSRLEVKLCLLWSADEQVLRKWAVYCLKGTIDTKLVSRVVLEDLDTKAAGLRLLPEQPVDTDEVQSRPVFLEGFWTGIEYPVARCRVENGRVILMHRPGLRMQPDTWYETRKAVYGMSVPGTERESFKRYIEAHRPEPKGIHHFIYNPFWSTPTMPSQDHILEIMRTIGEKLYRPHGVTFDSYGLTVFTTNPQSVWEVDTKRFPRGLTDLQQACSDIGSHLDIFLSPSSVYPPAMDPDWATEQGYETFTYGSRKALCLAGKRYQSQTKRAIVDMVRRYEANHVFVDGYLFTCPASDHGHEPGILSGEAVADGLIDILRALREASPNVWLAPTCFTWNASPWWSFYVHSVIGTYGDDSPYGRVPSPLYRESYTSARDYFNLQGAYWLVTPIAATESFGIIQQSDYPFLNDAVTDILRGNMEQHCAINPTYMTDRRWKQLALLMKWARGNADILQVTEPLLPCSWQNGKCPKVVNSGVMPREPYGYAHWRDGVGMVALRNPWIEPRTYSVRLPVDPKPSADTVELSVVSIYPEARVYGEALKPGDTLAVQLAPYETVVLSVGRSEAPANIPPASQAVCRQVNVKVLKSEVGLEKFVGDGSVLEADSTCLAGEADTAIRVGLDAEVSVDAPEADLLILIEDNEAPIDPVCRVRIDGKEATFSSCGSETGWAATVLPKPERWLFLSSPLPKGTSLVNLDLLTRGGSPVVSAWVWARKAGIDDGTGLPNALPQPEVISLDGANLLKPVDEKIAAQATRTVARPFERIDGIFLDALDPSLVRAVSGGFQKNVNAAQAPLIIAGRRYWRGLGVQGMSKLEVSLEGTYHRFQAWAGLDSLNMANYMDRSAVTFEVWVDGRKWWESAVVRNVDPPGLPIWVDVDITGAKTLELVVIVQDTHGHLAQNFADWADARLLR